MESSLQYLVLGVLSIVMCAGGIALMLILSKSIARVISKCKILYLIILMHASVALGTGYLGITLISFYSNMNKSYSYCSNLDLSSTLDVEQIKKDLKNNYSCEVIDTNLTQVEFDDVKHIFVRMRCVSPIIKSKDFVWEHDR